MMTPCNMVISAGNHTCRVSIRRGRGYAVQLLLGHTKVDSAVRYLGVEHEDALAIAEKIDK